MVWTFVCILSMTISVVLITRYVVRQGVIDEMMYPLANCDTSMIEEIMPESKRLRILHVNDQAGVAGLLAKYQRMLGHTADVMCRYGYDIFGQQKYYGVLFVGFHTLDFKGCGVAGKYLRLLWRTMNTLYFYCYVAYCSRNYDVVHIHSQYLVSLFLWFKPKVVEFHGSEIRSKPSRRWLIDKWVTSLYLAFNCKRCFCVSTKDLMDKLKSATYLPNPVDVELFHRRTIPTPKSAVYIHNWHDGSKDRAQSIALCSGLTLDVIDRSKGEYTAYQNMPAVLSEYEYFIDRYNIRSLSKTALEALAMGLKVIDYTGRVVKELPLEHHPLTVAKQTIGIYQRELC